MEKKKIFIGIGIFWVLIIGGFIGFKEFTLRTGEEVLLKTLPVDPRDLFRGDYVILRYDVSRVDTTATTLKASDVQIWSTVYVVLDISDDRISSMKDIVRDKPSAWTFIRGTVKDTYSTTLSVEYGIESYFVPENTGKDIEQNIRDTYVKVAIDSFGNAVIKWLILNGEDIK